ncbi:MAG: hypothetical protein LBF41_08970 [Deltaproteobacteria bacterium]|jgi:hypothetical protein|nr:hypothetical protein [Deltaproteobacteria bacterium]
MNARLVNDEKTGDGWALLRIPVNTGGGLPEKDFTPLAETYLISMKDDVTGQYLQNPGNPVSWDSNPVFFKLYAREIKFGELYVIIPPEMTDFMSNSNLEFSLKTNTAEYRGILASAALIKRRTRTTTIDTKNDAKSDVVDFRTNGRPPETKEIAAVQPIPSNDTPRGPDTGLYKGENEVAPPPPPPPPQLTGTEDGLRGPVPVGFKDQNGQPAEGAFPPILKPEEEPFKPFTPPAPAEKKEKKGPLFFLLVIALPLLLLLGGAAAYWYFFMHKGADETASVDETGRDESARDETGQDETGQAETADSGESDTASGTGTPTETAGVSIPGAGSAGSAGTAATAGGVSALEAARTLLKSGSPSLDDLLPAYEALKNAEDVESVKTSFELVKELSILEPKYHVNLGAYYDPQSGTKAPEGVNKDPFEALAEYREARDFGVAEATERIEDLREWASSPEANGVPGINDFRAAIKQ